MSTELSEQESNEKEVAQPEVMEAEIIEEKEAPTVIKKKPKEIQARSDGSLLGGSFEERYRLCKAFVASKMLPKSFDTPEKALVGIEYAVELGFSKQPLIAIRNIAVINGMPSIWGELPLALVMRSKELEFIDEYWTSKDGTRLPEGCLVVDIFSAVCEIKRKGFEKKRFEFTVNDITGNGVAAIWKSYKKVMMKRKARGIALKDIFPDVLLGVSIAEYDYNTTFSEGSQGNSIDNIEHDGSVNRAHELNNKF